VGEKTMNDDFFSKFRQSPRPEFNQSLYARLMQDTKAGMFISLRSTSKRIAFALAALCLTFALALVVSPTVRAAALAAVDNIITKITVRGVTVFVIDKPLPVTTPVSTPATTKVSESYSDVWTPVSPSDISANYSFFAKLPTWVPSGYTLQERAALNYTSILETPPSGALFEWKDNTGETIQLRVDKGSCPNGPLYDPNGTMHDYRQDCTYMVYFEVGPESEPQVIDLNGQRAVFIHGVGGLADLSGSVRKWNPSRWKSTNDDTKGAWMIWENNGRTFILIATSATITKEDVIRLAKSIP
jgi:hypothetical protein